MRNWDLNDSECIRLYIAAVRHHSNEMGRGIVTRNITTFCLLFGRNCVALRDILNNKGFIVIFLILSLITTGFCKKSDLPIFKSCNSKLNLEARHIQQGELRLVIQDFENNANRVSCDFTINAGTGRHVMFYFTDLYLGSPNKSERVDRACIEPRDVTTHFEGIPEGKENIEAKEVNAGGMRALICSRTEVEFTPRVYYTKGHALSIRFYRNRGYAITAYFRLVFTAFRSGSCRTSERRCGNDRCIAHDLVCNDRNPCGDFSDCPTGLEHLSSFALCGIVILGLLSGGIIIIMAAVCLQRSSSKNLDLDDFSSVNGIRQQDTNLELTDVKRKCDPSQQGSSSRDSCNNERDSSLHEKIPFCNGMKQTVNNGSYPSDTERLIKNGREGYREPYRRNESDLNLLKHHKSSSGNSDETVTTNMSSFEVDDDSDNFQQDQTISLMPEYVTNPLPSNINEPICNSNYGILQVDNASPTEEDHFITKAKQPEIQVRNKSGNPSRKHYQTNGRTSQPSGHVFTDFKPSAPHYGYTLGHKNTFDVPVSPHKPYSVNVK